MELSVDVNSDGPEWIYSLNLLLRTGLSDSSVHSLSDNLQRSAPFTNIKKLFYIRLFQARGLRKVREQLLSSLPCFHERHWGAFQTKQESSHAGSAARIQVNRIYSGSKTTKRRGDGRWGRISSSIVMNCVIYHNRQVGFRFSPRLSLK